MSIRLKETTRFSVLEMHEEDGGGEGGEAKRYFEKICQCIPYERAREASRQEREKLPQQSGSLTYGEVEYESLSVIFDRIREFGGLGGEGGEELEFVDLGSGCGRPLIAAALLYPSFARLVGVEILRGLYEMSLEVKREWDERAQSRGDEGASSITFIHGSILELDTYDWTKADIILANSTCFTIPFFDQIEKKAENCRAGTIFISLTHCLGYGDGASTSWELLDSMRLKMSWGHAEVSISRRR